MCRIFRYSEKITKFKSMKYAILRILQDYVQYLEYCKNILCIKKIVREQIVYIISADRGPQRRIFTC